MTKILPQKPEPTQIPIRRAPEKSTENPYVLKKDYRRAFKFKNNINLGNKFKVAIIAFVTTIFYRYITRS